MPISTETIVSVALADMSMGTVFSRSIAYWHHGDGTPVVIDGDCTDDHTIPDGGVLHVHGDLASNVTAMGHHEIIITGDVLKDASITSTGFCHVYIGGKLSGLLNSSDSTKLWIGSDFSGGVKTGNPSTHIYVGGNFNGHILPLQSLSLLYLTVAGFAANRLLEEISNLGYTVFNAAVACGDVSPGLYPLSGHRKKTSQGNSFSRWTVETTNAV